MTEVAVEIASDNALKEKQSNHGRWEVGRRTRKVVESVDWVGRAYSTSLRDG